MIITKYPIYYQNISIHEYILNLVSKLTNDELDQLGLELIRLESKCKAMYTRSFEKTIHEERVCCLMNAICIYASLTANGRRKHIQNMAEYESTYLYHLELEFKNIIKYLEEGIKI